MNTKELTRRRELCSSLNIDFDEASELFSEETLESMQMAKIEGSGFWASLGAFFGNPVLSGITAVITVGNIIYQFSIQEDTTAPPAGFSIGSDGRMQFHDKRIDSIKYYNDNHLEIWTNPTPTGQVASSPTSYN